MDGLGEAVGHVLKQRASGWGVAVAAGMFVLCTSARCIGTCNRKTLGLDEDEERVCSQ